MKTAVREQVNGLSTAEYFNLLATLMKDNPPAKADGPMLAKMASLGIIPGQPFDWDKLDPAAQQALQDVPKVGFETIMAHFKSAGTNENGWVFTTKTGLYGTDYLQRALAARRSDYRRTSTWAKLKDGFKHLILLIPSCSSCPSWSDDCLFLRCRSWDGEQARQSPARSGLIGRFCSSPRGLDLKKSGWRKAVAGNQRAATNPALTHIFAGFLPTLDRFSAVAVVSCFANRSVHLVS